MSNIIVLGAGMVGSTMAIDMAKKHDVTITDFSELEPFDSVLFAFSVRRGKASALCIDFRSLMLLSRRTRS